MTETSSETESLNLKAGWLCLDFANTAEWHASDQPQEHLNSYPDLIAWAGKVGLLTHHQVEHLLQATADQPQRAAAVLERAIVLREIIYRIFADIAHNRPPEAADLEGLNTELCIALARSQIISTGDGFSWGWVHQDNELDQVLWPISRSAAELLTSDKLDRVGQCADDRGCGWLFLDMSRNRSRRWCDMKDCGNRAKVRRYRRRTQNI